MFFNAIHARKNDGLQNFGRVLADYQLIPYPHTSFLTETTGKETQNPIKVDKLKIQII